MNKTIYYIILAVCLFSACAEDKGNYSYKNPDEIISALFADIDESYEVVLGEQLTISPTVTGFFPDKEYEYSWYIVTETVLSGKKPINKKISSDLNLDVIVSGIDETNYTLYLQIKDVETGVFISKSAALTVSGSIFTRGYYVLKEQDGMTDIDYVKLEDDSCTLYANLLKNYGGDGDLRLQGSPRAICYQKVKYYHSGVNEETGAVVLQTIPKVIHVASDTEVKTIRRSDWKLLKSNNEQFYDAPLVCDPRAIYYYSGVYFLNGGDIYTTTDLILGSGKYGYPKVGGGALFPQMMLWNTQVLCFDQINRTLYIASNSSSEPALRTFADRIEDGAVVSSTKMNYEMVAMPDTKYNYSQNANRALLMKSVIDNRYYTVDLMLNRTVAVKGDDFECPLGTFKVVSEESQVLKSSVFASQHNMVQFYFAVDNELYYYDHDALTEQTKERRMLTYPDNETITKIISLGQFKLAVLTYDSDNGSWKLYIYNIPVENEVNITLNPEATYTGKGKAVDVFYTGS